MKLLSLRTIKRNGCWLSSWYIDGEPFCFGLCPADGRQTPPGIYPVRLVMSKKFSWHFNGNPMPWIDSSTETDDYTKLKEGEHRLIHWLNVLEQTDGCEGVGWMQSLKETLFIIDKKEIFAPQSIQYSMNCFTALYARIAPAIDSPEGVTLEIRERPVKILTRADILAAISAADASAGGPGNASAAQITDEILKAVPTNGG